VIAERVNRARLAVLDRHGPDGPANNAEVDSDSICLASDATKLVEEAMNRLRLSGRGRTRVIRVARTIADLACAEPVGRPHVAEALSYRHRTHGRTG
jgi:magnesium chelatase family protein